MPKPRENRSRRHLRSERVPERRILVYCGGRRTEPDYLFGLIRCRGSRAVSVKVHVRGVDPLRLVNIALDHFVAEREGFDEVWCLSDVDEFDIAPAVAFAERHGVRLVLSRPCFEYWLILHHLDCRRPGMTPAQVLALLRQTLPAYDKTRLRFTDFEPGVDLATERAKHGSGDRTDPSTDMWRLVEAVFPPLQKEES